MTRCYHSSYLPYRLKSVSYYLLTILRLTLSALAVLYVSSCEEGPTKIGSDLLPSNDFVSIKSTDTLSIWSYTMYNSSVPTNGPSLTFIGDIYDPYFGTTTGEFVSQLRASGKWQYGVVTIDSVRLKLRLNVKGGADGSVHILRLSEISDQIYTDSVYYSDNQTDTTDFAITAELPVLKPDTINNISVPIPVEFGEYILRDTSKLFYSSTKPDFRSFFKGLYFRLSSSADPLLIIFDLVLGNSYQNYFVIYMHDTSNVKSQYAFILDPEHKNACYNKFSRDFSTADTEKKIEHINDENYRDTLSYVQYLNGLYTKIVFPGLENLKNDLSFKNYAINKARLTVPVYSDGDLHTVLTAPSSLIMRYESRSGAKYIVPDYYIDAQHSFFDGTLHKTDSLYSFNLAAFIQAYLEDDAGEYKPELEIFAGQAEFKNVILKANNNKTPVKFELTYTKF